MPPDAFLWELDAEAMSRLRSVEPLNAFTTRLSERVGRPWFEAAVNGVRLSEEQLPDVFALGIRAARSVGLSRLPEIYVSGENMWDAVTLGGETGAFVSLGSVLTNMRGTELLFLLAREMGHVHAGHALWRTVVELLRGRQGATSLMGGGLLQYLNPAKVLQGAIQAPLMAWKRHSEITADRAGLLAVGDRDAAQRVLMQWALKSFPLHGRINQDDWQRQVEESDDATIRLSEFAMTSNPYLARRLKLLREFEESAGYRGWRDVVEYWTGRLPDFEPAAGSGQSGAIAGTDLVRLRCAACHKTMRVPRGTVEGGKPVNVRCPNVACRKVMTVRPRRPPPPGPEAMTQE